MLSTRLCRVLLVMFAFRSRATGATDNGSTFPAASSDNRAKTPEDFRVQGLEEVEPAYAEFDGAMYAGLLPITRTSTGNATDDNHDRKEAVGEMMFWLFEPEPQETTVPETLVVWFNGGPGCSSFNCGVMMEHSPVTQPLHAAGYCCLDTSPTLSYNEKGAWTRGTTMLYIEQPIGTGFSYGHPLPETEQDVAADFDVFLQNFYKVFTHLQTYNFYVMGESYAGMFVPSVGHYVHKQNKKNLPGRLNVPLAGVAIGNGWMDGKVQGPAVIDYSWWHGLIDKPTRDSLQTEWENCMAEYHHKLAIGDKPPFHPFNVQDDCGIMWGAKSAAGNPNEYDITTWDPNVDQVTFTTEAFYNRPEVKRALNAPMNVTWHGCRWGEGRRRRMTKSSSPHRRQQGRRELIYMEEDRPLSVVPYVAELLDDDIPVLVYNGDRDMTTNMVGTELLLNNMDWKGKDEWLDVERGLWKVNDYPAGWAKEYKSLAFVVVYNSGHMVPYNQPVPAFDLLLRFLRHETFLDQALPSIRVTDRESSSATTGAMTQASMIPGTNIQRPPYFSTSHHSGSQSIDSNSGRWQETAGVAAVSMAVGFVLALLFVSFRAGGSQRRGYQRVPDAAMY